MKAKQIVQILLILVEGGILAFISENPWPPTLLVLLSLVGLHPAFPIPFSKNLSVQIFLLGSLILSIHWALFPPQFISFSRPEYYRTGYLISEIVLLIQVSAVFISYPKYWKHLIPYAGILVYMFAGIRILASHDYRSQIYGVGAFLYALLLGFYALQAIDRPASKHLPARKWVIAILLLFMGLLTLVLGRSLPSLEGKVTQFAVGMLSSRFSGAVGGWGESSHLRSVQIQRDEQDNKIVLRVFSKRMPGYVKGLVYDRYRDGRWITPNGLQEFYPSQNPASHSFGFDGSESLFLVETPGEEELLEEVPIWQDSDLGGRLFRILGTVSFLLDEDMIFRDDLGNLKLEDDRLPGTYKTYLEQSLSIRSSPADLARFLELDPATKDPLRSFAQSIFLGTQTLQEKLSRLKRHFTREHAYDLEIEIPSGEDPVVYFLMNQESAHCEYFASAAVILLRLEGIPARYVTGFLSLTKNRMAGYWVSTNEDAHAWVEVYHPEKGWMTFDPTPQTGIPTGSDFGWLASLSEMVWFKMKNSLVGAFGSISNTGSAILERIQSIGARQVALFAALLAPIVLLVGWRNRPRRNPDPDPSEYFRVSPDIESLRVLLVSMDRFVSELGFHRRPFETFHCFASRIEEEWERPISAELLVNWYRGYAEVRYSGRNREERIQELENSLDSLPQRIMQASR